MIGKPLVSIITPVYNAKKYIVETIESVIQQTYNNWEMLVIDDCSVDGTASILLEYTTKNPRVKYIKTDKNSGVAVARNLGLSQALGKYIAFLDSDDCWMPEKLERQLEFMQSRDIAFSFTSYQLMDENSCALHRYVHSKPAMKYQEIIRNTLIGCLTVMIDVEKVGIFQMPRIAHTEDTMTWIIVLKRGYIAYGLPDVLSLYRVTSNSMTSQKHKMVKLQWSTYRDYCRFGVLKSMVYLISYAVNAIIKVRKTRPRTI